MNDDETRDDEIFENEAINEDGGRDIPDADLELDAVARLKFTEIIHGVRLVRQIAERPRWNDVAVCVRHLDAAERIARVFGRQMEVKRARLVRCEFDRQRAVRSGFFVRPLPVVAADGGF